MRLVNFIILVILKSFFSYFTRFRRAYKQNKFPEGIIFLNFLI
jgi:hypothetical protein